MKKITIIYQDTPSSDLYKVIYKFNKEGRCVDILAKSLSAKEKEFYEKGDISHYIVRRNWLKKASQLEKKTA